MDNYTLVKSVTTHTQYGGQIQLENALQLATSPLEALFFFLYVRVG